MSANSLEELRGQVRGDLLTPQSERYDEVRSVWNGMIDRKPAAIVQAIGTADIVAAVKYARENDWPLAIRGGGHNIAGLAVCDGGLVIDNSRMRGAWVDHASNTVHVQPGATLGDVDRETQLYGKAAVLGFVSNTGVAGLTLGGGFGYLTRKHGWTVDNTRSMTVVTADGSIVRASRDENSDLFWGLCGGGGNFGVVTDIELDLHPVGPMIMAGARAWPGEKLDEILSTYREVIEAAPPELCAAIAVRKAPPAPWINESYHGKPVVLLIVCHTGGEDEARKDLEPFDSIGEPVGDVLQMRPYAQQQALLDATQPNGRRYYWKSDYISELSDGVFDNLRSAVESLPSPHSTYFIFPVHGALNDIFNDVSAVGNRDARYVINITTGWDDPAQDEKNISWARKIFTDVQQYSTGGTYINFQTEEEGDDRLQAAYGDNYRKLQEIKSKWDPDNVFCINRNIVPL